MAPADPLFPVRIARLEREFDALRREKEDERRRREIGIEFQDKKREKREARWQRGREIVGFLGGLGGLCILVETLIRAF